MITRAINVEMPPLRIPAPNWPQASCCRAVAGLGKDGLGKADLDVQLKSPTNMRKKLD